MTSLEGWTDSGQSCRSKAYQGFKSAPRDLYVT
jgi:hypothetical protein